MLLIWQRVFADEILNGESILGYPGGALNVNTNLVRRRQKEI